MSFTSLVVFSKRQESCLEVNVGKHLGPEIDIVLCSLLPLPPRQLPPLTSSFSPHPLSPSPLLLLHPLFPLPVWQDGVTASRARAQRVIRTVVGRSIFARHWQHVTRNPLWLSSVM